MRSAVWRAFRIAAAAFAVTLSCPPLLARVTVAGGAEYRLIVRQTRSGETPVTLTFEQHLIFRSTATGLTIRALPVASQHVRRGLQQRTLDEALQRIGEVAIDYRVTPDDRLLVVDREKVWARFIAAMADVIATSTDRDAATGLLTAWREMPADGQEAILGGVLPAILAREPTEPTSGPQPVRIEAGQPGLTGQFLVGEQDVRREADRLIRVTKATGEFAATPRLPARRVTILRREVIDESAGLIVDRREESSTAFDLPRKTVVQTIVSEAQLMPWYPDTRQQTRR